MTTENTASSEIYWLCPLYSFTCDCESIDLAEGIQIKHAPTPFKEYIDRHYASQAQRHILSEFGWATFLPYHESVEGLSVEERFLIGLGEHDRNTNLLEDLITALRLYQKGRVVAGLLTRAIFQNSKWSFVGSTIWTSVSSVDFFEENPTYKLQQSDLPEINKLLQNIRQWREAGILKSINITLERFNSAYHGAIEDRLIDQMIAFESLYLGSEQELTYKLALRTAFLLRNRKDFRHIVFTNMKNAYNYRSRIVHGDNPPTRNTLGIIVPKTEDYLRKSIKKVLVLLSQGYSLKQIRDKLDENILSNGRLLKQ